MIVEMVSVLDSLVRKTECLIVIHMVLNSSVFGSSFSTEYTSPINVFIFHLFLWRFMMNCLNLLFLE